MDSASLLSRESTTLSLANPQKGHFMALASNSGCWAIPSAHDHSDARREAKEREVDSLFWQFLEIVTVAGNGDGHGCTRPIATGTHFATERYPKQQNGARTP